MIIYPSTGKSYKQTEPAATWNIAHNNNRPVAVSVCVTQADGKLHQVMPLDIIILDDNNVQILFPFAVSGEARIA